MAYTTIEITEILSSFRLLSIGSIFPLSVRLLD